ncbi:MAG TPA: hypothetical protein VNA17_10460, partial [Pyrinomonadaceae bacterium]|nr:hypothetical protein [Pyrinomonadaceae bacterium]
MGDQFMKHTTARFFSCFSTSGRRHILAGFFALAGLFTLTIAAASTKAAPFSLFETVTELLGLNEAQAPAEQNAILGTCANTPPYDVVADFSLTSNPNCEYTYGGTATAAPNSTFSIYLFATGDDPAPGIDRRHRDNPDIDLIPAVFANTNASTTTYSGTIVHDPTELNLHPGVTGERAVVRFSAPTAGTYQVNGRFEGIDTAGTTTDVLVLSRPAAGAASTTLFSGNIAGYLDTEPFALSGLL